jgi:hypothetical protein
VIRGACVPGKCSGCDARAPSMNDLLESERNSR